MSMKHQGGIVMKKISFGWFVLFGMLLVPSLAFSSDIVERGLKFPRIARFRIPQLEV